MNKKIIFFLAVLLMYTASFTETSEKQLILNEYEALMNRVIYSKQTGFCFDGSVFIPETKTTGSEHSFFIEAQNIYIKVINNTDGKTYFTRCFDMKTENGKLAINSQFTLSQSIPITGHWNFFKLGKKLNITVCNDETCQNTEINLYEINEKPLNITDGIFFTFKSGVEKKAKNVNVVLNSKALPLIDLEEEKERAISIFKKMENFLTSAQIKEKREEFEKELFWRIGH